MEFSFVIDFYLFNLFIHFILLSMLKEVAQKILLTHPSQPLSGGWVSEWRLSEADISLSFIMLLSFVAPNQNCQMRGLYSMSPLFLIHFLLFHWEPPCISVGFLSPSEWILWGFSDFVLLDFHTSFDVIIYLPSLDSIILHFPCFLMDHPSLFFPQVPFPAVGIS